MNRIVVVHDIMQHGYTYECIEDPATHFDPMFRPELTPKEMLSLGVFGGKYMTDCRDEFPSEWYANAKLNHIEHDPECNFFKVNASLSLQEWQRRRWIYRDDPRGWFQWYCRYYMGRRLPEEDERQIGRWNAMKRHLAQVNKNCVSGDYDCRRVQRQALLHWAYDSRKI